MNSHILQSGGLSDTPPWVLQVRQVLAVILADYDEGVTRRAGQRPQHRHRCTAKVDSLRPCLAVW